MWYKSLKKKIDSTSGMVFFVSLANILAAVFGIIGGIIVARLLLPEELGLFNSFSVFTGYIILAQIGIPNGLGRELPFFLGRNDIKSVHRFASTALLFSLILGVFSIVISIIFSVYFLYNSLFEFAFGSIIIGITSFQTFYITKYLKVLYRSDAEFNKLAIIKIIVSLISLMSIFFVWKYGFYGLGVRVFLVFLIDLLISFYWRPIKVSPQWSFLTLKELFKVGAPIFFVASVYGLWPTIQRTVILSIGGVKALGLFALAIIVQNMLSTVNNSISSVSFPKMTYAYGKGIKFVELMKIPAKFIVFSFILYLLIAIIGWFLLPIVVEWLLPNYIEGVPAAKWMLVALVVSVFGIFSNVYPVIKKNMDRLKTFTFGILVWGIIVYAYYYLYGFDLKIFPIAMAFGYLSTFLFDLHFYYKYYKLEKSNIPI